jgi:hypothetical protein
VFRPGHIRAAGREVTYRLTDDHVAHIVRDAIRHAEEERQ